MTDITADLVTTLVADQFPQWAHLPVAPVPRQGWDNRTFRLGETLAVRLPSGPGYVAAVAKEDRALPVLAAHLPVPVPAPVATGTPSPEYPHPWSVRRWLDGEALMDAGDVDRSRLAADLGAILTELRHVPSAGGPAAGAHSFYRGCHPSAYADQVQESLRILAGTVDAAACTAVWESAMRTVWTGAPVWFHGDIAPGNLLTSGGALTALIDFGTCGVGDPACDLQIAWTYFTGPDRARFRDAAGLDDGTWARARAWTLWKALIMMSGVSGTDPEGVQAANLAQVLADPLD
ncbi:aminoglycoside phosphotransferase family protein [Glycomyces algeriensis]|uniref:Aminoglycoside phosphotransferase n=1 Tax=Glycomyces algeriensis TaxID=256037 RepID=A0A9W6GAU6_9ACTN|nr:aminoglycoside phosphotransferase family protein [Glycomyces algeriensis]MDA1367402.1 aminoglycoside phosphotransferase family protein [Glycomyces algeriensis]MDR7350944.1 aminoglycoside phosphotransferase (APT) family kinase protein [Glycomyces algeriensis]GLI43656.1 aminoglycoside phosphotransferase [Glycomyces algeriensis]